MKIWQRNTLAAAMLPLACGVLLVACSSNSGSKEEGKGGSAAKPNLSVTIYDRGNIPQGMGTIDNNRWTKWLNENGPVNAKYVPIPRGESVQKLNILFSSGNAPDVIEEFDANFRDQLYQQKQIIPVDDLIEKYSTTYKELMAKYPELKKASTKSDGKQYEFGRVQKLAGFQALFIREDWLKKLGLQEPQTVEELFNVAKAFAENDPDGNGQKDTYGIALSGETGGAISTMFQDVSWVVEGGKLVHDWDRAQAAVTFKKQLYDAGLADKDFLSDKNGQKALQDWINGKTGIFVGRTIDPVNFSTYYEPLKKNVPDAEVKAIKLPASTYGRFAVGVNNPVQMTTVINAKTKNTEAAMKYIDFMASKTTGEMLRYGTPEADSAKNANGCYVPKDIQQFSKEVSWNNDFQLLLQQIELEPCASTASQLDAGQPLQKDFIELIKENNEANLSPDVKYAPITYSEHMPALPEDLKVVNTNVSKIVDFYNKAIVSGSSYGVDQAFADAKSLWQKSGGEKLEEFYLKWYDENKDTAFLAKDMWKFIQN
ncbi:extracellular solute-binding protein [Paenibacillus sp. JDR-2]|uniref:extracellular solute-binding protein n=1 Tax=Paenibacillus sp. (strain JDR-2) TaxID=324057 RepID=UPI000166A367|nr:extracellular solute-binding protein [Paenibacillus sp. JDR-2]ACT00351.1 extracellular solute-binding protein family 1 [Paenibacillus sp. JDR-2]